MKKPFLDSPAAWTHASRRDQSAAEYANPIESHPQAGVVVRGSLIVMLVLVVAMLLGMTP